MFRQVFIFATLISSVTPINVTVCDCSSVTKQQLYKFNNMCNATAPLQTNYEKVAYNISTNQPETISFPAYLCATWLKKFSIKKDWLNAPDRRPMVTIPLDTDESQCRNLLVRRKCHDHEMTNTDSKTWQYIVDPEGDGKYWDTVEYQTTNCLLKLITLQKKCDDKSCTISTPFGEINGTEENFYIHNHNTIIWESSWSIIHKARNRVIESGIGQFFNNTKQNSARLQDSEKQITWHLKLPSTHLRDNGNLWFVYKTHLPDVTVAITSAHKYLSQQIKATKKFRELNKGCNSSLAK